MNTTNVEVQGTSLAAKGIPAAIRIG
jgi:hypothetical protein